MAGASKAGESAGICACAPGAAGRPHRGFQRGVTARFGGSRNFRTCSMAGAQFLCSGAGRSQQFIASWITGR